MIVFRADASAEIGAGHIMRCLALAQRLAASGESSVFLICHITPSVRVRLESEDFEIIELNSKPGSLDDAAQTVLVANRLSASWIVLDGYHFGENYQRKIKDSKLNLLTIDDYGHLEHYYSDIILNHHIYASEDLYLKREPYTILLLGPKYALIRKEFLRWQNWERTVPQIAANLLVALGGFCHEEIVLKVLIALEKLPPQKLNVVIVGANSAISEKIKVLMEKSNITISLMNNVNDMSDLLVWADIAISAGGTSTLEFSFMGLPSIVTAIADNQRRVVEELGRSGVAINLGWHENVTPSSITQSLVRLISDKDRRNEMFMCARALVDGNGAERVVNELKSYSAGDRTLGLQIRKAGITDAVFVWHLANDPSVRSLSFSKSAIEWKDHVKWFKKQLEDLNCLFFIALLGQSMIGQVRFDIKGDVAVISISLTRDSRGKSLGNALISLSTQQFFNSTKISEVQAYVKVDNKPSLFAFEKADYKNLGVVDIKGNKAFKLTKGRKPLDA